MAIRIGEVKSLRLSDDEKEVIVGRYWTYTGEVELRFELKVATMASHVEDDAVLVELPLTGAR